VELFQSRRRGFELFRIHDVHSDVDVAEMLTRNRRGGGRGEEGGEKDEGPLRHALSAMHKWFPARMLLVIAAE